MPTIARRMDLRIVQNRDVVKTLTTHVSRKISIGQRASPVARQGKWTVTMVHLGIVHL